MRFFTPLLFLALLGLQTVSAEGTRQVAPNGSIDVNGNATTDVAALHINHPNYNRFASYTNTDPQSRLYIHIKDPGSECIYLGFNWAHNNENTPNPTRINFEYRIKDPNGNIVYGPVTVTPAGAHIQNWSQAYTGPMQIHGAGGYDATLVTSTDLASQSWAGAGDYYIEFRDDVGNDLLIDFWDITVADCSGTDPVEKPGRIWSYNWAFFAINDYGFPNRPFNGAFYVCAPDPDNEHASFVTKIDFNNSGFRPAAFNVAFNSFGSMNTGDVAEDRKSLYNVNATRAQYEIFLNDPVDICETATAGEITILGISRCAGEEYCIKFETTKAGQIDLLLDFDGADNVYTPGTADVMVSYTVTPDQVGVPTCIPWDGLDGLGHPLPEDVGTQIPVIIHFAQGIYHFPIYDAEFMIDGFRIEAVRPAAPIPLLFYDDSNIPLPSGSGEPSVQLSGCTTPCHRWNNYLDPDRIGFGNYCTINSWWFSQLIIRQDVFFLPSYYACEIEGPSHLCSGGTTQLTFKPVIYPAGAEGQEIISTTWGGPGIIGPNDGVSIAIDQEGTYLVKVQWLTSLGDTCQAVCSHDVVLDPPLTTHIDTLIVEGETVVINGETYSDGGVYVQELVTTEGCDSILTIRVVVLSTVIYYDLNACESFMSNNTHMDYSEFVPVYPQPLGCATIIADTLYRNNPQMNKHSCTPGVSDTPGMCVGSLDTCAYLAGHDASVIIEFNVIPDADTAVYFTGFSFYEKAPINYVWISGPTGLNNYPTLFGVRILKNGTEIFRDEAIATLPDWNERVFDFLGNDEFLVKDPTVFRIELLPYCPVGNGATESVWDLDDIRLLASCASVDGLNKSIAGKVTTVQGIPLTGVEVRLFEDPSLLNPVTAWSGHQGEYQFENVVPETDYYVGSYDNREVLNGVNTLDLLHIQKHLLGIRTLYSPYQMIAADVNRSHTITVLDLIVLRKLILGIYDAFPNNTSWRFGIAAQELDMSNPWIMEETYPIEYLDEHITGLDFLGVKIGDINGDVRFSVQALQVEPRSEDPMYLEIREQPGHAGSVIRIDITSRDAVDLAGMQLCLGINGKVKDVEGHAMPLNEDHYVVGNDGVLRLSWDMVTGLSVWPGDVLFSIWVEPFATGYTGELVQIRENGLQSEAYVGESLDVRKIHLDALQQEATLSGPDPGLRALPNPFSSMTTIQFELEQEQEVTLQCFDLSGKMIYSTAGHFGAGKHSIELDKSILGLRSGMIICRLLAGQQVGTLRVGILGQ